MASYSLIQSLFLLFQAIVFILTSYGFNRQASISSSLNSSSLISTLSKSSSFWILVIASYKSYLSSLNNCFSSNCIFFKTISLPCFSRYPKSSIFLSISLSFWIWSSVFSILLYNYLISCFFSSMLCYRFLL